MAKTTSEAAIEAGLMIAQRVGERPPAGKGHQQQLPQRLPLGRTTSDNQFDD